MKLKYNEGYVIYDMVYSVFKQETRNIGVMNKLKSLFMTPIFLDIVLGMQLMWFSISDTHL